MKPFETNIFYWVIYLWRIRNDLYGFYKGFAGKLGCFDGEDSILCNPIGRKWREEQKIMSTIK
jgi:hypothetical protein